MKKQQLCIEEMGKRKPQFKKHTQGSYGIIKRLMKKYKAQNSPRILDDFVKERKIVRAG